MRNLAIIQPEPIALKDLDEIERRYREARNLSDISALTILAVEAFPALIAAARRGLK